MPRHSSQPARLWLTALALLAAGGGLIALLNTDPREDAAELGAAFEPRAPEQAGTPSAELAAARQVRRSRSLAPEPLEAELTTAVQPAAEPQAQADLSGKAVAQLIVQYDCVDPLCTQLKWAPMAEQVADANQLTSHPLPPDPIGSLYLEASPGWHIAWLEGPEECSYPARFELSLEAPTTIQLFGLPPRDLRVRVVSSRTGLGVEGATVKEQFHGGLIACTTDSQGRGVLPKRPGRRPGTSDHAGTTARLEVEAPGFANEWCYVIADPAGDSWSVSGDPLVAAIGQKPGPAGSSHAQVRDPSLAAPPPVAAAPGEVLLAIEPLKRVHARLPKEFKDRDPDAFEAQVRGFVTREGTLFSPVEGRVRREGEFDLWIEDLHPRGNYCLEARADGLFTQPTLIPAGPEELDLGVLPLVLTGSLSGTLIGVRDRTAMLVGLRCRCDALRFLTDELPLTLTADGSFRIEDLIPGTYRIVLQESGSYERVRKPSFELHAGEPLELGLVELE